MTPPPAPQHQAEPPALTADPKAAVMLVPIMIGCAVAVVLGVYASRHQPTGLSINVAGFSSGLYAKSWLATLAVLVAITQLGSAILLYRGNSLSWMPGLHRWSGRIAVLVTVPVVVHCLFALGLQASSPRVLIHSLLGCLFYGAFVTKMLTLTRRRAPGWAVPVLGAVTFALLVGLWLTSAVWAFGEHGVHL